MLTSDYNFEDRGRIPIRPLSFENKDLALIREVIINYETGGIYVKKEDGEIITAATSEDTMTAISNYIAEHPEIITEIQVTGSDGQTISIQQNFNDIYEDYTTLSNTVTQNKQATDKAINDTKVSLNKKIDDTKSALETEMAEDKKSIGEQITNLNNTLTKKISDTETSINDTAKKTYATIGHGHNYAGSNSNGGAAISANKVSNKLIIKLYINSTDTDPTIVEFDGSDQKTIDAADKSHDHDDVYYKKTGGDINGDVSIKGDTSISKGLTVDGNTFTRGNNTTTGKNKAGSQEITGDSTVEGSSKTKNLNVTANATVGGTLGVTGKATMGSQEVTGDSTINGNSTFKGLIILTSDCYGTDLPDSGTEGQLFFKIIEE